MNDSRQFGISFTWCLHEVAHAIRKHKSPRFDNLTEQENQAQEDEAHTIATEWFNERVEALVATEGES
jgi:Zn-dependent peptidase ImmA (M78 family)